MWLTKVPIGSFYLVNKKQLDRVDKGPFIIESTRDNIEFLLENIENVSPKYLVLHLALFTHGRCAYNVCTLYASYVVQYVAISSELNTIQIEFLELVCPVVVFLIAKCFEWCHCVDQTRKLFDFWTFV